MKTFRDVYSFPFELLEGSSWVDDNEGIFIFQFLNISDILKVKLLDVINGFEELTREDLTFSHENGIITSSNGIDVIRIRGWGYLTGSGGLNLSGEEASNIQDTLVDFIIERLNKRNQSTE